ncbi:peptidoglycan DD-metalloendopeptidase family protein [Azospirillum sp. TSO22-1]|uniref:murein hydrolase activator EnvC family protein n=1 Tax=Azospirillum sp. TSO22-1 TaxID=716789 RepID=UPI001FFF9E8B|nr:peptidoglycan DD-metalloendopeptidase family protein [Azospirillum sp. TSO22-1]
MLLLFTTPAFAQDEAPNQTLRRVEQEIQADKARQRDLERQSEAIRKELADLRNRLVGLAEQARAQESELGELERTLAALEDEERAQAAKLDAERQNIARLLAALQRLSRVPPEVVMATPDGPVDTLRSALLLRDTVPALRERADALAAALQRLADVRERLEGQRVRTLSVRANLTSREGEIAALVARREALSRQTDEERRSIAQHMARLASQAGDLRQLMERVEQERRATIETAARLEAGRLQEERRAAEQRSAEQKEADRKAAKAARTEVVAVQRPPDLPILNGGLRLPAGGTVIARYGEQDRFGGTSRGVTISARAGTPILAPYAGSVMFAGPFRGYGQILIVEHSNGYHSLIAGLGRIDTSVGKHVSTGEPVGLMPSPADGTPDLYFELRRHGQPINPERGFSAPEGKGQG